MNEQIQNAPEGLDSADAQTRLLAAAEMLFAERGFDRTSVRDITAAADCNVAAVNYHFRNKENLYHEVFRRRLRQMRSSRIQAVEAVLAEKGDSSSLEDVLRAYAHAWLAPLSEEHRGYCMMQLFCRELNDRRLAGGMFVEEMARPVHEYMIGVIQKVCPAVAPESINASLHAMVGQLVHYIRMRDMFEDPDEVGLKSLQTDDLVEHFVAFSAAGIRAFAKGEKV